MQCWRCMIPGRASAVATMFLAAGSRCLHNRQEKRTGRGNWSSAIAARALASSSSCFFCLAIFVTVDRCVGVTSL